MNLKKEQQYSLKTSMAMANLFQTVIKVYPNCITKINSENDYYMGVKQAPLFSELFLNYLDQMGFHLHTIDKASHKGRGIDIELQNPITGRFMTGSSSGTALNVFYGINDIGVGTDGGGSILSPAAALNLIGIIHPNFGSKWTDFSKYSKASTDGIIFTPSIGFISRSLQLIKMVSFLFIDESIEDGETNLAVDSEIHSSEIFFRSENIKVKNIDFSYKYEASREELIETLELLLSNFDIVISKEGPVDVNGTGDTLFGHFDERTRYIQIQGKKGFVRVVNMCNAIGLIVPSTELSTGYLIIAKLQKGIEKRMFDLAEVLISKEDKMINNYFLDHSS
ncbi:amidase family protein [Enterococcus faecium]|uniref:amidase family protein n=2 Tax=Enterococcus TaxID=1350 RepID=UPI0025B102C8|nr:amidase family protein [Enterococcus faecium]MDN3079784.1 amidase family protein [Enterococcus faecium]MDQ8233380.1 amidase family protein [Enterococcus faecium]MDQ8240710.1 amidase family protein [Enterococcus faecium]